MTEPSHLQLKRVVPESLIGKASKKILFDQAVAFGLVYASL